MKPQPCQLALWMSIAGLGTSLAGGVQARTHAWVEARPLAVEGWPVAAGSAPWPVLPIEQQGLLALSLATIEPLKPEGPDDVALSLHGTQPHPQAPAPRHAVNGLRVRTPPGPRSADRGSDLIVASDPPPDADRDSGAPAPSGEDSAHATDPGPDGEVAPNGRPAKVVAAFAALVAAEPVATRTVEASAKTELRVDVDVNLDLALKLDVDLDLAGSFDIDLGYEPVATGRERVSPPVQVGIGVAPARVDVELDIVAARRSPLASSPVVETVAQAVSTNAKSQARPQAGMQSGMESRTPWQRDAVCSAPSATLAFELASAHEVDVFLDLAFPSITPLARPAMKPGIQRDQAHVAAAVAPVFSAASAASAEAPADVADVARHAARGARRSASTHDSPSIVVGNEVDRVLHTLEAQVRKGSGGRSAEGGAMQPDVVFVATQEDKVLMTLETLLEMSAPKPPVGQTVARPAHESRPEGPRDGKLAASVETQPGRTRQLLDDKVALDDARLDNIRGGFQTPDGVILAFGIERAVYINGSLVTTTNLQVASNPGGPGGAPAIAAGSGNLTLIQNGAGNAFITGPVSAGNLGTVIQNTLNDQKIEHVLSVNATVNSLQLTRAQNFESAMRGALVDSLRR